MTKRKLTERDLRALRIFRAAAQAGGFAAAERMLGVSKATISRQIKMVEDRLGTQLCLRGPHGFELTEAGYTALRCAKEALDALDRIFPEVDAMRGIVSGHLTLGIADNVIGNPASRVPQALGALCRVAPDIEIALRTMTADELNLALTEGKVDIAIKGIHAERRMPSFSYAELFEEPHLLYRLKRRTADGDRNTVSQLVYRPGQPFVEHAIKALKLKRGPEATGIEAVATLVATGAYIGILPVHYAELLSPSIPLEPVTESPTYTVTQCAVTDSSHRLSRAASRMLDLLQRHHAMQLDSDDAAPMV